MVRIMNFLTALRNTLLSVLLSAAASLSLAETYEAKLPDALNTAHDLCKYAPCAEVLPGATSFSERKGQPPYVEGYADENAKKKLVGYVMLSTDITDTPAYSGRS